MKVCQEEQPSMKASLADIRAPIAEHLPVFEKRFEEAVKSKVPLLDKVMYYVVRRKGKQVRPMFVFLCAQLSGAVSEATHRGAALVELMHTASLIHDDVVDDADERRGFFSVNAIWKNKIAVLVGDYLLSKGLLLSVEHGDFDMLRLLSKAVREMSEGELLQIERSRQLNFDESVYYDIIRQKTASLIASACAIGHASNPDATKESTERMWTLGETIGIAFQIRDDLFDLGEKDVGKPRGIDIKEKKLTLPLIHTLNKLPKRERQYFVNIIKNHNTDKRKVAEVIKAVWDNGGIDYARQAMFEYRDKALEMLQAYQPSPSRNSLEQLIHYTINREK